MPTRQMVDTYTIKEGAYIGRYKDGDIYYYQFSPVEVKVKDKTKYYRIGEDEELPGNRTYILSVLNKNEQKLVDE